MRRIRKTAAVLGIVLIAVAVFLPVAAPILAGAILVALWLVTPDVDSAVIRRTATRCFEQPVSLFSLVPSRAPPARVVPA